MIHLEPITQDNYRECMRLEVAPSQVRFVAPVAKALGEAYVYYQTSRPFAIYCDEQMVGFLLLRELREMDCYYLSQFMIAADQQQKGYGRQAMRVLVDLLKEEKKYPKVDLCYVEEAEGARRLYEGLGFKPIDKDANEIIMELLIED